MTSIQEQNSEVRPEVVGEADSTAADEVQGDLRQTITGAKLFSHLEPPDSVFLPRLRHQFSADVAPGAHSWRKWPLCAYTGRARIEIRQRPCRWIARRSHGDRIFAGSG